MRSGEKVPLEGNTGDFYEGKQFAQYLIFDESIKFIRENKDRPFFCYCAWTPPHGRWGIPEDEPAWLEFKDKPWPAGQRRPEYPIGRAAESMRSSRKTACPYFHE